MKIEAKERGNIMSSGLTNKIFTDIRTDIINGVYPIGSKLPTERDLAEKYTASRFAVREAIAMLSQTGFVETLPQSGTYVKDYFSEGSLETLVQTLRIRRVIDRQTLDSLLKFRVATETDAAAEAALRLTGKDIEYLTDNLRIKEDNLDDVSVLAQCDYDFHYKIVTVSGNIISRLVFQSFKPIYSFFTEFFYSLPDAPAASLALNNKLLEVLKKGDKEASFAAMADILHYGEKKIYGAIDDREQMIEIRHGAKDLK